MKNIIITICIFFLCGCTSPKEAVMPFRNLNYSGERIFPLQQSDAEKAFRVWFNGGSSVDRLITISHDSIFENQSYMIHMGVLFKKNLFKEKRVQLFDNRRITLEDGIETFLSKVDSLDLFSYENQKDDFQLPLHSPFSLYIIEIKDGDKYNQFRFNTYFPNSIEDSTKYGKLELFIFEELLSKIVLND